MIHKYTFYILDPRRKRRVSDEKIKRNQSEKVSMGQPLDRYFENMSMIFGFKDDVVHATFSKTAEHFLTEYTGRLIAKKA